MWDQWLRRRRAGQTRKPRNWEAKELHGCPVDADVIQDGGRTWGGEGDCEMGATVLKNEKKVGG